MKIDNIDKFRRELFSNIRKCGYSVVWKYDYIDKLNKPATDYFSFHSEHLENVFVLEDVGIHTKVFITVDDYGVVIWVDMGNEFVERFRYKLDYIRVIKKKEEFYTEFALHLVRILCVDARH